MAVEKKPAPPRQRTPGEAQLDEALDESFPASDPVAISPKPPKEAPQPPPPSGSGSDPAGLNPGDEAPPGTPGSGDNVCPVCHGSGRLNQQRCSECGGSGVITSAIGGA
jgi:hypothetical protein